MIKCHVIAQNIQLSFVQRCEACHGATQHSDLKCHVIDIVELVMVQRSTEDNIYKREKAS